MRGLERGWRGYQILTMDKVVTIQEVEPVKTRSGTIRFVVRDTDGDEYTTFRESIGQRAQEFEGKRVRIEYHEQQRGQYTNVYLDKVEAAPPEAGGDDSDPEEAAWRTAVDAAPVARRRVRPARGRPARRALRQAEALPGACRGRHPRHLAAPTSLEVNDRLSPCGSAYA